MKIKRNQQDKNTQKFWENVDKAQKNVEKWPEWKRNVQLTNYLTNQRQVESILEKTCQGLRDLGWADPNEVEDIKAELSQARATMMVNFGPEGKTQPGLVSGDEKLNRMIVKVFRYYV